MKENRKQSRLEIFSPVIVYAISFIVRYMKFYISELFTTTGEILQSILFSRSNFESLTNCFVLRFSRL